MRLVEVSVDLLVGSVFMSEGASGPIVAVLLFVEEFTVLHCENASLSNLLFDNPVILS